MARKTTFTFRVDDEEKKMIAILAERLQRSQSDVVRLVIREAVKGLLVDPTQSDGGSNESAY